MSYHRGSKGPLIIDLYHQGLPRHEIAKRAKCSEVNVSIHIKRHKAWSGRVAPLPKDKADWLKADAAASGVTPDELARAMLVDAIAAEMQKDDFE